MTFIIAILLLINTILLYLCLKKYTDLNENYDSTHDIHANLNMIMKQINFKKLEILVNELNLKEQLDEPHNTWMYNSKIANMASRILEMEIMLSDIHNKMFKFKQNLIEKKYLVQYRQTRQPSSEIYIRNNLS